MEPPSQPSKKRRLMPKEPPSTYNSQPAQFANETTPQQLPAQEPPNPERHDFESFARHLQDAAMLIQRQTERPPYSNVSVLLLRWEEDTTAEADLAALENIFRDRFNYRTDRWNIPTVANPSIKLGVQMASFLEHARANHLLIIYYAGYGYVGTDGQLYWACNARENAAKLKWDGVRCLFEDAQSDILLLLDTCAIRDMPVSGSHGMKQAIAACTSEHRPHELAGKSFTYHLIEALHQLGTGRPFSVERLYDELVSFRQQEGTHPPKLANGTGMSPHSPAHLPVLFTLTPGKGQSLSLAPLPARVTSLHSPAKGAESSDTALKGAGDDQLIDPESVADLRFDEARVLVCTTFVGDASPDMSSFNGWLHNTPPLGAKITVEGMFLGPPTMLLISMPHSIWNVVQHDKVCCFLGYITSHNMTHLYEKLVGSSSAGAESASDVRGGRPLPGARQAAFKTPSMPQRPIDAKDVPFTEGTAPPASPFGSAVAAPIGGKRAVEDSAEIQEAAEQLKALSHVRHLSDESVPTMERQRTMLPDGTPRQSSGSPRDPSEPGADDALRIADLSTPNSRSKPPRRSLLKAAPKQETRCTLCSHEPFKDSSSLRKHVAAAHTRPFPCAFSFAGCSSTFGSKNEWKRHISSQHLCLTYYRCSSCPLSTADGKGNEFNRKDLFTQHLRRMHAPFAIKKAIAKGDSKLQADWDGHVKEMQQSCLVIRRSPPQRSACPKQDCGNIFEGTGAWDEWTEHVGRHMEKGEGQRMGVDRLLAKWALEEGIIERKDDGEYRLLPANGVNGNGGPADMKDPPTSSFPEVLDPLEPAQDSTPEPRGSAPAEEKMELDD